MPDEIPANGESEPPGAAQPTAVKEENRNARVRRQTVLYLVAASLILTSVSILRISHSHSARPIASASPTAANASQPASRPKGPFDPAADAHRDYLQARDQAQRENKFLLVDFGANWCPDCLALDRMLHEGPSGEYFQAHFLAVRVDVDAQEKSDALAGELGVSLARGIPAAVIFAPDGRRIGSTNDGELEPARHFTPAQIQDFLRTIVEKCQLIGPRIESSSERK